MDGGMDEGGDDSTGMERPMWESIVYGIIILLGLVLLAVGFHRLFFR